MVAKVQSSSELRHEHTSRFYVCPVFPASQVLHRLADWTINFYEAILCCL